MSSVFSAETPRFFTPQIQIEASSAKVGRKRHSCGDHFAGRFPGLVDVPSLITNMRDPIGGLLGMVVDDVF
jgi:hypothetical protein